MKLVILESVIYLLMVLLKMNHAKNWLFPHAVQSLQ